MFIGLLGPVEVIDDGRPIPVPGARLRTLLARLAAASGRPIGVDALIEAVWSGDPPANAANALQSLISRLRRILPPDRLVSSPSGYQLVLADDELDVSRFEALAATARATRDPDLFDRALELWRGDPEPPELIEPVLAAVRDRAELCLALGRPVDLAALVARYPGRNGCRPCTSAR